MIKKLPDYVIIDGVTYIKPLSLKEQLRIAREIAIKGHDGQTRKFQDVSYFEGHVEPVALRLRELYDDPTYEIIGLLHDVLEDTEYIDVDLLAQGIGEEIVCIVKNLTRTDETYFDKIRKMKYQHMARKVKLVDLEHNMSDLKEGSLKDKYRFAHEMLTGFEKYWEERKGKKKC